MSIQLSLHAAPFLLQAAHPAVMAADFDEDGVVEEATVSFSPMQEILVTVSEPDGSSSTLNLGAFPDLSGVQEEARVSLLGVAESGVPLLRVQATATEWSAAWEHDIFVSYTHTGAHIAFETIRGADDADTEKHAVSFSPAERALVHTTAVGDARLQFADGVYVPAP